MRIIALSMICLFITCTCNNAIAQKKVDKQIQDISTTSAENGNEGHAKALYTYVERSYQSALQYGDLDAAKNALYLLLSIDPGAKSYKDTLAMLYYENGNYVQSLLIGNEILEDFPKNEMVLDIVAVSQQNLGLLKEALATYEKLFVLTGNIFSLYQVASIQYTLKRFGECADNLESIITSPDAMETIAISAGQGRVQDVPIIAAAYNMKGVLALDLKDTEQARLMFEEAIKIAPDFELAHGNLASMDAE